MTERHEETARGSIRRRAGLVAAVAAMLCVGLVLRLAMLGRVPLGFHPDEAHNALDALRIAGGWRPAYLPGNNGREPLFTYVMAAVLTSLGPSIWAARLTAVVAGMTAIPAQYVFARALPLPRPRLCALASAAVVSFTFWPVAQSRYAIEAVALPAWAALALWAWWRCLDGAIVGVGSRRRIAAWAALAGMLLAGAAYTHLVGRLLAIVVLGSAAWCAARHRRPAPLAGAFIALGVAAALLVPQLVVFAREPDLLVHRSAIVSVFNPAVQEGEPLQALATNAWRLATAPNVRGDSSWSHNLRRRPVFDPVLGVFFLVGVAFLARDLLGRRGRRAQDAAVLLALGLAVGAAPSLLSIGAPNYTRLVGIWPVLFLLPAWGLERTAAAPALERRGLGAWVVAGALAACVLWTARDYFVRYAPEPRVAAAFLAPVVERGNAVADLAREGPVYAMPALWRHSVVRFLAAGKPVRSFDPTRGIVVPAASVPLSGKTGPRARYVFDPSEAALAERTVDAPNVGRGLLRSYEPADVSADLAVVEIVEGARLPPSRTVVAAPGVRIGDRIVLEAMDARAPSEGPGEAVLRAGSALSVTLRWRAIAPTERDMNFFVHAVDASGRTVGQADGPPLDGSYATDTWLPGDTVVQTVDLVIAHDASPGPLTLRTGFYDWRTLERLPVADSPDNAVVAGAGMRIAEG